VKYGEQDFAERRKLAKIRLAKGHLRKAVAALVADHARRRTRCADQIPPRRRAQPMALEAAAEIRTPPPAARAALGALLGEIAMDARQRAEACWRRHNGADGSVLERRRGVCGTGAETHAVTQKTGCARGCTENWFGSCRSRSRAKGVRRAIWAVQETTVFCTKILCKLL